MFAMLRYKFAKFIHERVEKDEYWQVKFVRSRRANPKVLGAASTSEVKYVRTIIAGHKRTPGDVLVELSSDKDWFVRLHVSQNPFAPAEALWRLGFDRDPMVRKSAMYNKHYEKSVELFNRM